MNTSSSLEAQRIREIAEEYRKKGYEVIEQPSRNQLPEFMAKYRPDLIVRKGQENKVIEVKSRLSLHNEPYIRELAKLVQNERNWKFELATVKEIAQITSPEDSLPFEIEDILSEIETAQSLQEDLPKVALLLAWTATEATIRLITQNAGLPLENITPRYIIHQATTNGLITRDDFNFLTNAMKYRNAFVHGFKIDDFDYNLVTDLINTTKRLLPADA